MRQFYVERMEFELSLLEPLWYKSIGSLSRVQVGFKFTIQHSFHEVPPSQPVSVDKQ